MGLFVCVGTEGLLKISHRGDEMTRTKDPERAADTPSITLGTCFDLYQGRMLCNSRALTGPRALMIPYLTATDARRRRLAP